MTHLLRDDIPQFFVVSQHAIGDSRTGGSNLVECIKIELCAVFCLHIYMS